MAGKAKIVVVTGWYPEKTYSDFAIASKLVRVLEPSSSQITWLAANLSSEGSLNDKTALIRINSKYVKKPFWKVFFYFLLYQVRVVLAMLRSLRLFKADVVIFSFGADLLLFPILLSRLAGKKVIIRSDDRPSFLVKRYSKQLNRAKVILFPIVEKITYALASKIVLEYKYMTGLYNLDEYSNKVGLGGQYIDISLFKKTKELAARSYEVGYIGRFSEEKGALEFVKALPSILANRQSTAIVIGDGAQKGEIEKLLARNNIQGTVDLLGWVEHKEIPNYLNDIRILVIPSHHGGFANIVLEAMACGTVVLATPVGGTPEVIRDGETGFIMRDNSPECIARNVMRALNHPDLEQIATNAHALIKEEYTYEAAVERYRNILTSLKLG